MRIKHEFRRAEPPRSLLLSKTTQEVFQFSCGKSGGIVSPETQSHRFKKGWKHLQNFSENALSSTNNNNNVHENLNTDSSNNNIDDFTLEIPSGRDSKSDKSYICQGESDDSESSSEDEDSSLSFSDTSPLLDVSSLDSSSSNESSDAEMSDDVEDFPENDNQIDNNNFQKADEEEEEEDRAMDTSWASLPSMESSEVKLRKPSLTKDAQSSGLNKRNGVVLPDVLPLCIPKRDEDTAGDRKELELQLRRRELKLDATPRIPRDCCIVEITTQPDIQVDIRLNPAPNRPFSDTYMKQRNTYPRDTAGQNYNFYFKSRDAESQCSETVKNALSSSREPPPRYFAIGEGVRLNNFTLVNGFKALSLTEFVKSNGIVKEDNSGDKNSKLNGSSDSYITVEKSSQTSSLTSRRSLECCEFAPSAFNLYSKENRRNHKGYIALEHKSNAGDGKYGSHNSSSKRHEKNNDLFHIQSKNSKNRSSEPLLSNSENGRVTKTVIARSGNGTPYPYHEKLSFAADLEQRESLQSKTSHKKQSSGKLSSPELFDVYTMETAVPLINTSGATLTNRETEWIKKRQNDREEIRRKLAMDSDNEDYVGEKLNKNQESFSVDRLKGGSNLQICFLNEAAKEHPDGEQKATLQSSDVPQQPVPRVLKRNMLFPPNLPKCAMNSPKLKDNNNTVQPPVTKRQRPTFIFNRPRSWHAAKVDDKPGPVEDLYTCHQRIQEEAREALAQAKEMARMQMEIERQKKKKSPIADIVGIPFPDGHNPLGRPAMLEMNVAQLQVIVNDLHSQIETLNEDLVKFLLDRDDLHMEQDSMLVDIEDLTRYLGLKGSSSITQQPDAKFSASIEGNAGNNNNNKLLKPEPVRRSQSVHLKKPKNFVWPWHRPPVFSCTYGQG